MDHPSQSISKFCCLLTKVPQRQFCPCRRRAAAAYALVCRWQRRLHARRCHDAVRPAVLHVMELRPRPTLLQPSPPRVFPSSPLPSPPLPLTTLPTLAFLHAIPTRTSPTYWAAKTNLRSSPYPLMPREHCDLLVSLNTCKFGHYILEYVCR